MVCAPLHRPLVTRALSHGSESGREGVNKSERGVVGARERGIEVVVKGMRVSSHKGNGDLNGRGASQTLASVFPEPNSRNRSATVLR